ILLKKDPEVRGKGEAQNGNPGYFRTSFSKKCSMFCLFFPHQSRKSFFFSNCHLARQLPQEACGGDTNGEIVFPDNVFAIPSRGAPGETGNPDDPDAEYKPPAAK